MTYQMPRAAAAALLERIGITTEFKLEALTGGGNNRVFRVRLAERMLLLKAYFYHPDDPRDRLGTEFSFIQFAWRHNLRCLPQPLACDQDQHLALYEFITGRRLRPQEISWKKVQQALYFFTDLNRHKDAVEAQDLPSASEACFSLQQHLQCVERRLVRLQTVTGADAIDKDLIRFRDERLSPAWQQVVDLLKDWSRRLKWPLDETLPARDLCLSPSDFGFHNAIETAEEMLYFIDFEYAGWDDPAKMVCDFFCQPALPVSLQYYDSFVNTVVGDLTQAERQRQRIQSLLPVYQIKWCCILLNDFLPTGNQRRRFAGHGDDLQERKKVQLEKAAAALANLTI